MRTARKVNLIVVLSLVFSFLLPVLPARAQDAAPAALLTTQPADGASWAGEPVLFSFDKPIEPTEFTITPNLIGDLSSDGSQVTFTPSEPPAPGVRYEVTFLATVDGAAHSDVELTLVGAQPLLVTATQPGDGATEVATDSQIVVSFNRPVVPLVGQDQQADLPQPLAIEPAVDGAGQWLNTSIYAFKPTLGLAGATDYRITVEQLTSVANETMAEPMTFSFTTAAPVVVESQPNGSDVRPDATVQVVFSQPMDRPSSETAFSLTGKETGDIVGVFSWDERSTTLTFTPTNWLAFGEDHLVRVDGSAQPASQQGNLRMGYEREFRVVQLPEVISTNPSDGAKSVPPDASVIVRFSAPLSRTLLMENIQIAPLLTTTTVYSYYNEYEGELRMDWVKEPRTTYQITLGAGIGDEYGNTLGEDQSFSFTTGDYPPFVRIDLDRYTHFTANRAPRIRVLYRNMDQLAVEFYKLPLREFLKLNGENQWELWNNYRVPDQEENLIWSRTYTTTQKQNVTAQRIVIADDGNGGVLPPGLYLMEVERPPSPGDQGGSNREQVVLVLSNHSLVVKKSLQGGSLAWITDAESGQPVPGDEIAFYTNREEIGLAPAGDDGVARTELTIPQEASYLPVLAVAGEPGEANFAVASSDWNNGVAIWDFGLNGGYSLDPYQSFYYSDRPIYRPGQTVYWKGIVRQLVGDDYQLPPADLPVQITVRNDRGNSILEQESVASATTARSMGRSSLPPTRSPATTTSKRASSWDRIRWPMVALASRWQPIANPNSTSQ